MTRQAAESTELVDLVASELGLAPRQVAHTAELLAQGATVPFVARYRKEATGGLDEVAIIALRDRLEQLRALEDRRQTIRSSLEERGLLSEELAVRVAHARTLARLEDIYLPFRPKRRTRASVARERGLEPLAREMLEQHQDPMILARDFVDPGRGVDEVSGALAGARDIIAEWVNEDADCRAALRSLFFRHAAIRASVAKGKEDQGAKYRDYYSWEEPAATAPSHRVLAVLRGAEEGFLTFRILPSEDKAMAILYARFVRGAGPAADQVRDAMLDSYRRLLGPSLETEVRIATKQRADAEAIRVFAENVRNLLMSPPLGRKRVMAVDPGLRTGCKVACLDHQGALLHTDTVFPLEPFRRTGESAKTIVTLVERFQMEAIAVGNGTGGREALAFCRGIEFPRRVPVFMVNESGASVYSASEVARRELPDHDVTVRGAVSIGRRLIDPLAELVKIDPKSIGVGQYQHDVDQKELGRALDDVVSSCVNAVGVELNTASASVLRYVSGLSERLADAIISYRDVHGPFPSREAAREVRGMGPKTFEQAAGFLRIRDGDNPLDASGVHPERYGIVEKMAADIGCGVLDMLRSETLRARIRPEDYVSETVGLPTLRDIMEELARPGRDPRDALEQVAFAEEVREMEDLKVGMRLPGMVTNVTAFGAFVDIGVHHDGLVHLSELSDRFIRDPHQVVKVQQPVTVTVIGVDLERRRISLSMRSEPLSSRRERPAARPGAKPPAQRKGAPPASTKNEVPPPNNPFASLRDHLKPSSR